MRSETPWEGVGVPEEQELHPPGDEFASEPPAEQSRSFSGKVPPNAPRKRCRLLFLIAGAAAAVTIAVSLPQPRPSLPEPIPVTEPETLPPETEPPTIPETEPPTIPETEPPTVSETEPPTVPETEPPTIPETEPPTVSETEPPTVPETEPPTIPETEPPTIPETEPPTVPTDAEILVGTGSWQGDGICVHFDPGGSGWWDGGGRYGLLSWSEDEAGAVHYSGWGSWTVVEETESGDSGHFYPVSKLKKGSCSGIAVLTSLEQGYLLSMDNPIGIDCTAYSGGQPASAPEAVKALGGQTPIAYMQGQQWVFAQHQDGSADCLWTDIHPACLTFGEDGCTVECQVDYQGETVYSFRFLAEVEHPENQPDAIRLVLPECPLTFSFSHDSWTVTDGIYRSKLNCSLLLTEDGPRMAVTALNEFISYACEYVLLAPEEPK